MQLSVHEWDRAVDGDPAGYYGQYDSVNLLTVLQPFRAVDLAPYKLLVRTRNVVPPPPSQQQRRQQEQEHWTGSRLVVQVGAGWGAGRWLRTVVCCMQSDGAGWLG